MEYISKAEAMAIAEYYGWHACCCMDAITVEDVAPIRHGYWKGKPIAGLATVKCSACGMAFSENTGKWSYCPNCGAKMDLME